MTDSELADGKTILIRADGGPSMGTGHIMRCFSIAQKWLDLGGSVTFVKDEGTPIIDGRMVSEGVSVKYYKGSPGNSDDLTLMRRESDDVQAIILDGYHFTKDYRHALSRMGNLMVLDDLVDQPVYECDLLLNYNTYASMHDYIGRAEGCKMLLGPSFFPLRREFWEYIGQPKKIEDRGRRLLLTMGGSDPHDTTSKILHAVSGIDEISRIDVVIGSAFKGIPSADSDPRVVFHHGVEKMSTLMYQCDLAISSAGTTSYELAFMRLPTLLISIADNQYKNARSLSEMGVAINLGSREMVRLEDVREGVMTLFDNLEIRRAMSITAGKLVDGLGSTRLCRELLY